VSEKDLWPFNFGLVTLVSSWRLSACRCTDVVCSCEKKERLRRRQAQDDDDDDRWSYFVELFTGLSS